MWPLGHFLKAVYAGYHGYALPEARVCWGDCRGSLLAVGWPPEVSGSLGSLSRLYGGLLKGMQCIGQQGMSLGIPRVRLVSGYGYGYEKFHKTLN